MKLAQSHTHNFLIGAIALGAVAVIGASMLFGALQSLLAPLPAAKPAPAPVAAPARHAPIAPAHPAHTATAAAPAPAPVALGPVMLPAQPAPAGVRQGYAQRAIASAPIPATYGDAPQWVALATTVESSPTGSWSTAVPQALGAIAPSSGLIQTTVTADVRIAHDGLHVLILSVAGGPAKASLTVDGQAAALASVTRTCSAFTGCPQDPTTAAGSVTLAKGLHVVSLTAQDAVGDPAATLDIYMRGPGAAMPMAITPWAVPADAAANSTSATVKTTTKVAP